MLINTFCGLLIIISLLNVAHIEKKNKKSPIQYQTLTTQGILKTVEPIIRLLPNMLTLSLLLFYIIFT